MIRRTDGRKKVLILPWSAHEIDWEKKLVNLDVNHRKVKDRPAYDPSTFVATCGQREDLWCITR